MANKKRDANRRRSEKDADMETRGRGTYGTPLHTERRGKGQHEGAGQLMMGGPGVTADRITPHNRATQLPAKGDAPKGMKTYREE